jgi:hypothetical protein
MSQQGQLIHLKRKGRDGEPVWAYRYRVAGRGSKRVQRGGFASERARRRLSSASWNGYDASNESRDR